MVDDQRPPARRSSATRRSSASRSTASCRPPRRCSAAARPPTTARRRTPTSARSAWACRARCRSINRRAVEHVLATGRRDRGDDAGRDPLGPQELLLPGPAEGLPDQPVRPAARVARPADLRDVGRARSRSGSRGPTSRRTRPSSSTPPTPPAGGSASSTSTARAPRSWRSSPIRTSGRPSRPGATPRSSRLLLRAIGASDADMERGQMRVEANVSLRPRGTEAFGTRVEVKNMNSFRSVERAIAFEIERQAAALDAGETLTQDTRGWNEDRGETYVMRSKEDSPTTTATSRSRTCRRCASTRPGWRRSATRCRSCRPPGGPATSDDLGPARLRRRGARRRARRDRAVRGGPGGGAGPRPEVGRELGHRRVPRPAARPIRRPPPGSTPAELADLVDRGRRGRALRHERARRSSRRTRPTGRRVAAIIEARGFRQISDAGAARAARRRGRSPPTRRPSPTTGPASRRSASSSARS